MQNIFLNVNCQIKSSNCFGRLLAIRLMLLLIGFALIAGCSNKEDDIRSWMKQQKEGNAPIPQFKQPPPQVIVQYQPNVVIDPFKESRAVAAEYQSKQGEKLKNELALEIAEKQKKARGNPLELNSLAEMKMIGYLNAGRNSVGMVMVDNNLYRVKVGDLLGNKFGIIQSITEDSIIVIEKVTNEGKFVDRKAVLSMGDQGGKTR